MAKKTTKKTRTKVFVFISPNGVEGFYDVPARNVLMSEAEKRGIVEKLEASPYHELREV